MERVAWFYGGLFDHDLAFPLTRDDLRDVPAAAKPDWSDVDPAITGTLFERGPDPDKIMQSVNPVIVEPLIAEWTAPKTSNRGPARPGEVRQIPPRRRLRR